MGRLFAFILPFWLLLSSASVLAEPLKVGMPLPGQVPFFWRDDAGEYRGIYADVLRLLARDLEQELVFVPLSQARLLKHFEIGEVDIEAGVTRQPGDSAALRRVSLFSQSFGLVNEVIIYRPELSFPVFI